MGGFVRWTGEGQPWVGIEGRRMGGPDWRGGGAEEGSEAVGFEVDRLGLRTVSLLAFIGGWIQRWRKRWRFPTCRRLASCIDKQEILEVISKITFRFPLRVCHDNIRYMHRPHPSDPSFTQGPHTRPPKNTRSYPQLV